MRARERRTPRRGIRRLGDEYLVLTYDETGIEHVNTFATMREARSFQRVVRLAEQRKLAIETATSTYSSVTETSASSGAEAIAQGHRQCCISVSSMRLSRSACSGSRTRRSGRSLSRPCIDSSADRCSC